MTMEQSNNGKPTETSELKSFFLYRENFWINKKKIIDLIHQ